MWLVVDDEWVALGLCLVNVCALLVGKYSIYSKHFNSKFVLVVVMGIEMVVFIGLSSVFTHADTIVSTVAPAIVGSYVSAALWDARSFNIESLSWRKKLTHQAFYVVITVSILLALSGSVMRLPRLNVLNVLGQVIAGVLVAEITYSVCKRKKLLSPAWRGMRLESRYDSRLSSTLTTPTSDRVIRI